MSLHLPDRRVVNAICGVFTNDSPRYDGLLDCLIDMALGTWLVTMSMHLPQLVVYLRQGGTRGARDARQPLVGVICLSRHPCASRRLTVLNIPYLLAA